MEHHVYFWLSDDHQNPADRAAFVQGLESLLTISTVAGGRWAVPAPVEIRPAVDQSWDYALSIQFATLDDHNAYQVDPIHDAFLASFKAWWAKVLVSDLA